MVKLSDHSTLPTGTKESTLLVFNRLAALKRMDQDEALLDLYLVSFVKGNEARLAEVNCALDQGNAAGLELAAHNLKGGAAMAGAERVSELASRLELMGQNGDFAEARTVFAELALEMDNFLAHLSRLDVI